MSIARCIWACGLSGEGLQTFSYEWVIKRQA